VSSDDPAPALAETAPSALRFRDLGAADLGAALALSKEAGWNQSAEDWHVFLDHGRVFGACANGQVVASAATLPYDGPFGFVAMVLVTAERRHRGLATTLLRQCLDELRARALVPVLDATPAGREVYRRLGFNEVMSLQRWEAPRPPLAAAVPPALLAAGEIETALRLDAEASGAARGFLLRDFLARVGTRLIGGEDGFAFARRGRSAMQVGPVIASNTGAACALLEGLLGQIGGPVILDVPTRWPALAAWLERQGFRRRRPFTRMALGREAPFGDPSRLFAVAGPEFG